MHLAEILTLEPIGDDRFLAITPPDTMRPDIFGGQVAGQALRAATLTIDGPHLPNSAHCYFMRRGNPDIAQEIRVERTRDGRTYASRSVEVVQEGKVIFAMLASFHTAEPGLEYDHAPPRGIPDPESLPDAPPMGGRTDFPLEMRNVASDGTPVIRWWGRIKGAFPADPAQQLCALLYASDMRAGGAAMAAIGFPDDQPPQFNEDGSPKTNFGSLDHAVWFHRVPDVSEWFYTEVRPLTVRDSRGLVSGTMHDRHGRHLASFTQEMFLKVF
jgi:acyl-CoA thioesterase-2